MKLFLKSSKNLLTIYDEYGRVRERDIKKISLIVLFKIFKRSSNKMFLIYFEDSSEDFKEIFLKILYEDLPTIFNF